jgi:hypothetical protein
MNLAEPPPIRTAQWPSRHRGHDSSQYHGQQIALRSDHNRGQGWYGRLVSLGLVASALGACAALAVPPDWSDVPSRSVTLFYPGQSSYEWLQSSGHRGAKKVASGGSCVQCHWGDEAEMGTLLASGGELEPTLIPNKWGSLDLRIQAAYDDRNLYLRFQWPTQFHAPGRLHDYMRYDGQTWEFYGGPRSAERVRDGAEPPLYEDRLSIMIDDGTVPLFAAHGCWLTCHNGARDMPDEPSSGEVKAHPLLGLALNQSDVRKYLPGSRTGEGWSWRQTRPPEEIARLKGEGYFVDLMQWRAHRSNPIGMADDGYVLEYRWLDEGKGPFSWNVDRETMTPIYMFDEAKAGISSMTVDDLGSSSKPYALIREENAVAYDPGFSWRAGDVLPGRLLSRADAAGSAADNNEVRGVWENGAWTVTWTRPLDTGHPMDDKILKEGEVYNVGLAVHDDNVTTRFHFVSLPITLGIGAPADVEAVRTAQ